MVLRELKQMTNDQAICSKCWMPLRKMILKIPFRFSLKVLETEDRSNREEMYLRKFQKCMKAVGSATP